MHRWRHMKNKNSSSSRSPLNAAAAAGIEFALHLFPERVQWTVARDQRPAAQSQRRVQISTSGGRSSVRFPEWQWKTAIQIGKRLLANEANFQPCGSMRATHNMNELWMRNQSLVCWTVSTLWTDFLSYRPLIRATWMRSAAKSRGQ